MNKISGLLRTSSPLRPEEMKALRTRGQQYADGRFELYKVSLKYDNPEARLAHNFPIDTEQKEVKEMLRATENTGQSCFRQVTSYN